MAITRIDDPDDERLGAYRNVPDGELLVERGLFVAEGRLVVRRLIESQRFPVRSVMTTAAALAPMQALLDARDDLPVYVVPQAVMNGITGFNVHRGCLALGERSRPCRWQELMKDARRAIALEGVGNADNVGSVFRSASAFGVDAVLLERTCIDPLYRKAIRTSMGAALTMPSAAAEPWPEMLRELTNTGWTTVAMTPSSSARPLREVAPEIAKRRVILVVGHEGDGLSQRALDACAQHVRIPMMHNVDSLNVATAAAIALYELS